MKFGCKARQVTVPGEKPAVAEIPKISGLAVDSGAV
jgi:hypothetical protein